MLGYLAVAGYLLAALASGGRTLRWTGNLLGWLWLMQPLLFTLIYTAMALAIGAMFVAPRYRPGPVIRRIVVRGTPAAPTPPNPATRQSTVEEYFADLVTSSWGRTDPVTEVVIDEPDAEVLPFRPSRRRRKAA